MHGCVTHTLAGLVVRMSCMQHLITHTSVKCAFNCSYISHACPFIMCALVTHERVPHVTWSVVTSLTLQTLLWVIQAWQDCYKASRSM